MIDALAQAVLASFGSVAMLFAPVIVVAPMVGILALLGFGSGRVLAGKLLIRQESNDA
jgi:hypothetical protein